MKAKEKKEEKQKETPDPGIVPPVFDRVTEGYDPDKVHKPSLQEQQS